MTSPSAHAPALPGGHGEPGGPDTAARRPLSVLLYSDDVDVRGAVRLAVGRRPAADLPEIAWKEVATPAAVVAAADAGGLDLLILDGEAAPAGGMGLCKQLKDEIFECPPVLVLIGRPQDAWLATWSRAEAAVPHPIDPIQLAETVTRLLRRTTEVATRAPSANGGRPGTPGRSGAAAAETRH